MARNRGGSGVCAWAQRGSGVHAQALGRRAGVRSGTGAQSYPRCSLGTLPCGAGSGLAEAPSHSPAPTPRPGQSGSAALASAPGASVQVSAGRGQTASRAHGGFMLALDVSSPLASASALSPGQEYPPARA